jgi:hypothetical protein
VALDVYGLGSPAASRVRKRGVHPINARVSGTTQVNAKRLSQIERF